MPGGSAALDDRPPAARRAGYVLAVLLLVGTVGSLCFWLREPAFQPPARAVEAPEATVPERWVDPALVRVEGTPAWTDPRWLERVRAVLAEEQPFALEPAPPALERLRTVLASLSFVEGVERLEASAEHGLVLALTLRKPVACLPVGGEFALVDEDGVVLEGRWPMPPRLGLAPLPVLGPLDDPLFARARAGDWLAEPEHVDALDVALSLATEVPEEERAALGRIWIDARAARRASLEEPGVRLELEDGRQAFFGRAPSSGEPGELAAGAKWRGLVRAFDWFALDPTTNDWALVDLRWDRPDLALARAPELALAGPERALARAEVGGRARHASGPRVR